MRPLIDGEKGVFPSGRGNWEQELRLSERKCDIVEVRGHQYWCMRVVGTVKECTEYNGGRYLK